MGSVVRLRTPQIPPTFTRRPARAQPAPRRLSSFAELVLVFLCGFALGALVPILLLLIGGAP